MAAAALALSTALALPAWAETVLRIDEAPIGELDPAKASDYSGSVLMFNAYDALVMPKQGALGYEPLLAASWETTGTTYTFKLKPDVKFQSGNALTAEDVVFSFDRMKALGAGLSYLFTTVDKAEAVDPATVKFTLKERYAPFISALTRLPILDKKPGRRPGRLFRRFHLADRARHHRAIADLAGGGMPGARGRYRFVLPLPARRVAGDAPAHPCRLCRGRKAGQQRHL